MMNNVERFYKDGSLTVNVDYKAIVGNPLICVDKGTWYKFQIEKVEELEDQTYDVTTTKLISVDSHLIKE